MSHDAHDPNQPNPQLWDLPYVDADELMQARADKTNALNRRSDWKYEPPEEEEEIKPPTLEEIEAIRQAAREEGFAEGRQAGYEEGHAEGLTAGHAEGLEQGQAQGHQQGLEEGRGQMETDSQTWQELARHLHAPLDQVSQAARQQLVQLAVALARAVIRTEVATNEQIITQALSEGMRALPITEQQFQIHMNPQDIALITDQMGADKLTEKGWQLVEAPEMQRGGCDIITQTNAVDVSVERRCREVLDTFLTQQGLSA